MQEVFSTAYAADMEPIVALLASQGIDYEVETENSPYNPYSAANRPIEALRLFVPIDQFQLAQEILMASGLIGEASEEEGYRQMLGGLDNDELMEIVVEAPKYPAQQARVARAMLEERGVKIDEAKVAAETASVIDAHRQPMHISSTWGSIWILFSLIGAPISILACVAVLTWTGRDLKGDPYPFYDEKARNLAKILLVVSVLMSGVFILVRVLLMD